MSEMPQANASLAYKRMIDALDEAASCARQLAFYRSQNLWLKVDENILRMRSQVIQLAEAAERNIQ